VFDTVEQERYKYVQNRFKELIAGTESDHLYQEDGALHGTCIADHEESWEHWHFYFALTNDEIAEMEEEYEARDTSSYGGPGRAFHSNVHMWKLPGNNVLLTQFGGLDI
jgi:hypothetical protein